MTTTESTAEALQTEVTKYLQYAANEADALLRCLTAERDALQVHAATYGDVSPALLTFTLTSSSDAGTGHRHIELTAARATGLVEANGETIGLVHCEVKHTNGGSPLFQTSERRTEAATEKAIEATCKSIVRALLLA